MPVIVRQDESIAKEIVCKNCGGVNKYYPKEVRILHVWMDYGAGNNVEKGFNCAGCGKEVITDSK